MTRRRSRPPEGKRASVRECSLFIAVSLTGCGGLTSYQKAAMQFGSATSAGVAAVRNAIGSTHQNCQMLAYLEAVQARFETPGFQPGTDPLSRSSGVSNPGGTETLTWGDHCAHLSDYDTAIQARRGLKSLADHISTDLGV